MKKMIHWMLAAILLCGSSVFASSAVIVTVPWIQSLQVLAVPLSALVAISKFKAEPSRLPEAIVLRVLVVAHLRLVVHLQKVSHPPAAISPLVAAT